ncbi:MAG: ComF family protein [Alysiella sp.]|uniref:ComF family protein n=1 Tax=Alysiella sp. TaxID=1872483 RepID=UPI0026DBE9CF|nr:ComF family protein [Alysiella sp.]MDO4434066.1 ComF family protein [Alysiella sp.]
MFSLFVQRKSCLLCHAWQSQPICEGCLNDVQTLFLHDNQVCPKCARPIISGSLCGQCQTKPPFYDALWASCNYTTPLPALLHEWKHICRAEYGRLFSQLMLLNPPLWLPESQIDAVLGMPLSRERRLQRGFNQSDELAQEITRYYNLPLLPHYSVFRQHRPPQSTLAEAERQQNVRHIFQVAENVKNRKILIIDDVVTTGATLSELARTLRKSGAAAIYVWVVARN